MQAKVAQEISTLRAKLLDLKAAAKSYEEDPANQPVWYKEMNVKGQTELADRFVQKEVQSLLAQWVNKFTQAQGELLKTIPVGWEDSGDSQWVDH